MSNASIQNNPAKLSMKFLTQRGLHVKNKLAMSMPRQVVLSFLTVYQGIRDVEAKTRPFDGARSFHRRSATDVYMLLQAERSTNAREKTRKEFKVPVGSSMAVGS
ncbi:hypothetical protein DPMN_070732 [Dreissena polymorpha]|uniref:Uncharacterized protein n=1 Tax=Dreissena polymorpha TaxID=45954 RepID=A0A9D4BVB4_DREPO|nr:hypothetical protein DPMN_070732 [Dreissena polymorpha]